MARGFFITGTDTDVGKTTVALGLMAAFKEAGLTVAAFKPVSAGCIQTENGLRNDDAVQLMQKASVNLPYDVVNPYAFEPAIAPHIAAAEHYIEINLDVIVKAYQKISAKVDIVIVEGAGGWLVPINDNETMADVAKVLDLDVVTVIGIRLGCLNHALLTSQSITASGLNHRGWIANHLAIATERATENITALRARIPAPLLDEVPYGNNLLHLKNSVRILSQNIP